MGVSHGALEKIRRPRRMPAPRILLKLTRRGAPPHSFLERGHPGCALNASDLAVSGYKGPIAAQVPGPRDVFYCGNSSLASSASCRALKRARLWTAEARGAGSGRWARGARGARWARGQRGRRNLAHRERWAADLPNPVKKGDACPRPGRAGKRDSR